MMMHTLFSPLLKEVLRHVHYSVVVLLDEIQKGINKHIKAILKVYRMFQLLIKKNAAGDDQHTNKKKPLRLQVG